MNSFDDVIMIKEVEWGISHSNTATNHNNDNINHMLAPPPCCSSPNICQCATRQQCNDNTCVLFASLEECGPNCPAGSKCHNNWIQRNHFLSTELFHAGQKGTGLRLSKREICLPGDFLCEYVGLAIAAKHLNSLLKEYQHDCSLYILKLNDGVLLMLKKGGVARFINHS
jgi:hypothetical protein